MNIFKCISLHEGIFKQYLKHYIYRAKKSHLYLKLSLEKTAISQAVFFDILDNACLPTCLSFTSSCIHIFSPLFRLSYVTQYQCWFSSPLSYKWYKPFISVCLCIDAIFVTSNSSCVKDCLLQCSVAIFVNNGLTNIVFFSVALRYL